MEDLPPELSWPTSGQELPSLRDMLIAWDGQQVALGYLEKQTLLVAELRTELALALQIAAERVKLGIGPWTTLAEMGPINYVARRWTEPLGRELQEEALAELSEEFLKMTLDPVVAF